MKKLLLLCSMLSMNLYAEQFKLDPSHTNVGFKVKHLVISNVTGRFNKFEGGFEYSEKDKTLSNIKITIEATSIDTNEPDRDKHLRSEDFFDVEKFKTLEFVSTKIANKAKNKYSITGDLTIHGIKKSVVLDAELNGPVLDPWKNKKMAFTGTTQIKRAEFGLVWNKALEAGGVVVDDKINIIIEGESSAQ